MSIGFNKESDFEEALIEALQRNGWERQVLRYPTEEDLIQNWAQILYENNPVSYTHLTLPTILLV